MRREFIANAAHELRTPLTNLQGYLEALRDGVIEPDRATFESLWDEAERLVRLSRSLDTLAAGDAGVTPSGRRPRPRGDDPRSRRPRPAGALAAGLELTVELPRRCPPAATPTSSPRSSATCSRTRSATRRRGGRVAVRAERRPADVLVSVTNTGDGIPPRRPAPRVRALLPGREVARPGARRRGDRPRDRPPDRRGGRRRGRRGVARRA